MSASMEATRKNSVRNSFIFLFRKRFCEDNNTLAWNAACVIAKQVCGDVIKDYMEQSGLTEAEINADHVLRTGMQEACERIVFDFLQMMPGPPEAWTKAKAE